MSNSSLLLFYDKYFDPHNQASQCNGIHICGYTSTSVYLMQGLEFGLVSNKKYSNGRNLILYPLAYHDVINIEKMI